MSILMSSGFDHANLILCANGYHGWLLRCANRQMCSRVDYFPRFTPIDLSGLFWDAMLIIYLLVSLKFSLSGQLVLFER